MWMWMLIALNVVTNVHGYASIPFPQACKSMLPQHLTNNVLHEPQKGEPPFEINYELGKEGEPIRVSLKSNPSAHFRGFMLEAREQDAVDEGPAVGRFILLDAGATQLLDCGSPGSAVIQKNNRKKTLIQVNWTAEGEKLNITFRTTFLQEFHIFWEPVNKNVMIPPPTPTTITSTSEPSSTSSTAKPVTTTTSTTNPSTTASTSEPSSTSSTAKPVTTTTSTTNPIITASTSEPSSTSGTAKPGTTASTTNPIITASTSEPSSTSSTAKPVTTTTSTTNPIITASTSEPSSLSSTAKPVTTTSTTNPSTTASTTNSSTTASTTNPIITASTSEPSSLSSTAKPVTTTTSTTNPSTTASTTNSSTTASTTNPIITASTSEPSSTSFTSEPGTTTSTTNPSTAASTSNPSSLSSTAKPVTTTTSTTNPSTTASTTNSSTTARNTTIIPLEPTVSSSSPVSVISVTGLQPSKDMMAAAMTTMTFDSLGVVLGMELCNILGTITSFPHELNKGIKITCTVLCAAAEISALVLCCVGDFNKAVLVPLVVTTMVINFIELIIEALPLGSKLQSKADVAAKVCSVIHELFTIAVMFVAVWETDHCRKNENESWLVTVMAVYTAWMFLFMIWVFLLNQTKLWRKVNLTVNPEKKSEQKKKHYTADKAFSVILIVGTIAFNVAIIYGIFGCPKK